jgi:hypothetical protein
VFRRLPELKKLVSELESRIRELEAREDDPLPPATG